MKQFFILILLALFIVSCQLLSPIGAPPDSRGGTPNKLGVTPMVEEEPQKVVQVRWSINGPVYQTGLEAGSTAKIELSFSPSVLQVTRRADGSIYQTSSGDWKNHTVIQMRYCVALDKPCSDLGELDPFQEKISTEMKLDWLGTRQFYLNVEFLDRNGKPVPATDGWDSNTLRTGTLLMNKKVTTALNPTTPIEKLPSPILTAAAATRTAFPVIGSVKIEGSPCCRGGTAGSKINLPVTFQASSSAGKVTEMRVGRMCSSNPADIKTDWEPYMPVRTYETSVALNWTTFYISVQYRDDKGNLSEVYCDNLGLEGSPVYPTQKP